MFLALLCNGDEEADKEQDDDEKDKGNGVLESSPETASKRLDALFGGNLVVFLMPEVGKGYDKQAQDGVEAVQGVVDDLELEQNVVHLVWRRPILLPSQLARCRCRDEGNVDGHEQHGCEQGQDSEDAHYRDERTALARSLIHVHKDGRDQ